MDISTLAAVATSGRSGRERSPPVHHWPCLDVLLYLLSLARFCPNFKIDGSKYWQQFLAAPVLAAAGLFFTPSALFTSEPMVADEPIAFLDLSSATCSISVGCSDCDPGAGGTPVAAPAAALMAGTATAPRGTPSAVAIPERTIFNAAVLSIDACATPRSKSLPEIRRA